MSSSPIDLNLQIRKWARIVRPQWVKAVGSVGQVLIYDLDGRRHLSKCCREMGCVLDVDPLSIVLGIVHDTLLIIYKLRLRGGIGDWLVYLGVEKIKTHLTIIQEKEQALCSFEMSATSILVATDVAARGLYIPHFGHMMNFDLPNDIASKWMEG
ncbi:hypothetical protein Golob_012877, partial [Gossypium lobatum]|nr:hypothetical protein [Gossypium lobatum]